jgi:hypothetical protein
MRLSNRGAKLKTTLLRRRQKMKKLLVLVLVAAMCLPCYGGRVGRILVYKMAISYTTANFETDPNGWLLEKGSVGGYLVLNVDNEDPNIVFLARYIDCYTEQVHGKSQKQYDIWTSGIGFEQSILPGLPPKGKNITALNLDLWNEAFSLQLTGWLLGTNSPVNIGTYDGDDKTKEDVATSLKGVCRYISGEDLGDVNEILDEQGTGTVTATLDAKWTKIANDPNDEKGFGGDVGSFLDQTSGPPDNPDMPRGLVNWLINVQKYHPPIL